MHTPGGAHHPAESGQAHFAGHQTKQDFPDKGASHPADLFSAPFTLVFRIEEQKVMTSAHDKSS
jgi:hypothetical protein